MDGSRHPPHLQAGNSGSDVGPSRPMSVTTAAMSLGWNHIAAVNNGYNASLSAGRHSFRSGYGAGSCI
jgi:hypothetical protein